MIFSLSINNKKVSAPVLLDLSAAFDTIEHFILLTRLANNFGITGTALSLLSSYLNGRSPSVSIGNSSTLIAGVPQGSVLSSLLFCLYTSPFSQNFSLTLLFPIICMLDDTQLYISFNSSDSAHNLSILSSVLDSVYSWFISNRLGVNPSKTEYFLIGNFQQRAKVFFCNCLFLWQYS